MVLVSAVLVAFSLTSSVAYGSTGDSTGESTVSTEVLRLTDWDGCLPNYMCLFVKVDGKGGGFAWPRNGSNGDFRTIACGPLDCNGTTFDDDASSWWNRTGQNFCVSDGYWGGNPDNTMPAGTRGNFTPDWNDRASSLGYLGCP
jgi:hypothetical protein